MAIFKLHDIIEIKATGRRGKIDQIRDDEPRYLIEFDNDHSTIDWKRTDEISYVGR